LGIAAAAVVNLINPSAIIIGGGVAPSFQLIVPSMLEEMRSRAFRPAMKRIAVLKAGMGDDAGILGAAALAFSR
jgi:glucokinase